MMMESLSGGNGRTVAHGEPVSLAGCDRFWHFADGREICWAGDTKYAGVVHLIPRPAPIGGLGAVSFQRGVVWARLTDLRHQATSLREPTWHHLVAILPAAFVASAWCAKSALEVGVRINIEGVKEGT